MLTLYIEKQRFSADGKILESKADISHSFVKNFLGCLYRNMSGLLFSMLDQDGSTRNYDEHINILAAPQVGGGSRVYAYDDTVSKYGDEVGILIGTGSAGVSAQDYYLSAKIDHGVSAGEMEYFGGRINDPVIDGSDTYFDIERIFRNSSGGSIVIKEYGLAIIAEYYSHLIIRDAYAGAGDWITVADGEYLKVTYRIKVTV